MALMVWLADSQSREHVEAEKRQPQRKAGNEGRTPAEKAFALYSVLFLLPRWLHIYLLAFLSALSLYLSRVTKNIYGYTPPHSRPKWT